MTDTTEALRAKFEAWFSGDFPRSVERNVDGEYKYMPANSAWQTYQAGHAAGVAAERERCANLAADLAADACVAYANGEPMSFREMVGNAIREGQEKG